MTLLLVILYPLAIQIERGGWWRLLLPITVLALIVDVLANYTELVLLTWDWPAAGEYTFSTRCVRLQYYPGWAGCVARFARWYTNYFDPLGDHIHA